MEYALYRLLVKVLPMGPSQIPLRRHGIGHVETYEVLDHELNQLEREGCDVGFDFQVAQFCLTSALSFLVGLVLSPPQTAVPRHLSCSWLSWWLASLWRQFLESTGIATGEPLRQRSTQSGNVNSGQ